MNTQDIRWKQRIDNYNKALNKLTEAVRYFETGGMSEIEKEGLIQRFEYS